MRAWIESATSIDPHFPSMDIDNNTSRAGFVGIMGPVNAGKSTLLNTLLGSKVSIVSPKPQTTRNKILGIKTRQNAQIIYVDTPGFVSKKYRGELPQFLENTWQSEIAEVDFSVLVVDAHQIIQRMPSLRLSGRRPSLEQHSLFQVQCDELVSIFKNRKLKPPSIVALNKVDLLEKNSLLPLICELHQSFCHLKKNSVEIVPISAKSGMGIENLETLLLNLLPVGPFLYPPEMITDQSENFLAAEIIREKLMYALRDEVPYSVAVQIEQWQQKKELLVIHAVIWVERAGQKAIVIGEKGEKLKSIGTASRMELELFFKQKVYLELFVRVEEGWTQSKQGIRKAGYG